MLFNHTKSEYTLHVYVRLKNRNLSTLCYLPNHCMQNASVFCELLEYGYHLYLLFTALKKHLHMYGPCMSAWTRRHWPLSVHSRSFVTTLSWLGLCSFKTMVGLLGPHHSWNQCSNRLKQTVLSRQGSAVSTGTDQTAQLWKRPHSGRDGSYVDSVNICPWWKHGAVQPWWRKGERWSLSYRS